MFAILSLACWSLARLNCFRFTDEVSCYMHAALRHQHSFPTRRSSDLDTVVYSGTAPFASVAGHVLGSITNTQRSEEHTSELQSLRHLVCRLLLEKNYPLPLSTTKATTRSCESTKSSTSRTKDRRPCAC